MKEFIGIHLKDFAWKKVLILHSKVESLVKKMYDEKSAEWLKEAAGKTLENLIKRHLKKMQGK